MWAIRGATGVERAGIFRCGIRDAVDQPARVDGIRTKFTDEITNDWGGSRMWM